MRLFIILLLSSFCWTIAEAQSEKYDRAYYEAFPVYDDVALTYFDEYQETQRLAFTRFEKRKEGWFADYSYAELHEFIKIWDAKTQKYIKEYKFTEEKKAKLAQVKAGANEELWRKIEQHRNLNYYIQPLAGYEEATMDVINLFEGLKLDELTFDELQGLARAYDRATSWAYGFVPDGEKAKATDLKLAQEYSNKTLELFAYLAKNYPKHEGVIGEMPAKYSAVCMNHWMLAQYYGMNDIDYLAKANYPSTLVARAKNYLKACPPNAILVTGEDHDFYSLCYVQQKLGFRTDVIILNELLLQHNVHLAYLHKQYIESGKLKLSVKKEHYKKSGFTYMLLVEDENPIHLSKFLERAKSLAWELNVRKRLLPKEISLIAQDTSVTFRLNSTYVEKNNILLLDIIQENSHERPICWVNTANNPVFKGLGNYNENVFIVQTLNLKKDNSTGTIVNHEKVKDYFLNDFEASSAAEFNSLKKVNRLYLDNTLETCLELIEYYQQSGKNPEMKQLVDKLFELYPPDEVNYGLYAGDLAVILADATFGRKKDARILLDNYARSFKQELERSKLTNTTGYFTYSPLKSEEELRKEWSEDLQHLKSLNNNVLAEKLKELSELIEK